MAETEVRSCQSCAQEFVIEPEDFYFYKKIDVPPPTFCPQCRLVRRMSWRNENTLYRRQCGLCQRNIITVYSPDSDFRVYCHECWVSDRWDGKEYATDYRHDVNFFVQFRDLLNRVPLVAADMKGTMINSEYGNYNGNCKNCYMCFAVVEGEDSSCCSACEGIKECVDSLRLSNSELCYGAIESEKDYRCSFIERTRESSDSAFIFGSANVSDSFMAKNLKNAKHMFRGAQLDKEEYEKKRNVINLGSFKVVEELKKEFLALASSALCKYAEVKNVVEVTGNNITNSKYVYNSFDVSDSENVKYSLRILKGSRDIHDCHGMFSGELVYEGFGCGFSPRNNLFSFSVDISRNLKYSAMCRNCADCFGCIGLKNQQYCILNKQYSKEEYEALIPQIMSHMEEIPYTDKKGRQYRYGEFFPSELSPFGYNETIAQDYFPLTKERAETSGYLWKDDKKKDYQITKTEADLPDDIRDTEDDIVQEVIGCIHQGKCNEKCTTAFRITPRELELYRKIGVALPRLCLNCRYAEKFVRRNPLALWPRKCMCLGRESSGNTYINSSEHFHGQDHCSNEFKTSYAPDRPEVVYCEQCYNAEIV